MANKCNYAINNPHEPGLEGYYDGTRAWALAINRLSGQQRTKVDRDFYRTAERLQTENKLADGCRAEEFVKKALAFIVHISPNLAQPYSKEESAEYIVDLMPKRLAEQHTAA